MSARQLKIVKAILESLNALEGGQMTETLLHAEVNLRVTPTASRAEFEDSLQVCDSNAWVVGVQSKFGGLKLWNLSDAGQAARLEMR
jgi:hypothetical protein